MFFTLLAINLTDAFLSSFVTQNELSSNSLF